MHGVREPASDSAAPLIGAIIDITDIARSLKVASANDTPSSVDPTRVGRFTWDQTSGVIQLSPEAAAIIGVDGAGAHTQAEFDQLAVPDDVAELSRQVRHAMPGDILDLGIRVDHGDVRRSLHLRAIASAGDSGGLALIGTIQDVDDEAAARQAVVNVTRALNTLSHATKVLNTAPDEQTLIEDICRTVVRDGGYHFAWYRRKEDDSGRSVTPVASAGYEDGYLDELRFSWDGHDPAGGGPTGHALPRPPTSRTRAAAPRRYWPTYLPRVRRIRVCSSTRASSSRVASAALSVSRTSSASASVSTCSWALFTSVS